MNAASRDEHAIRVVGHVGTGVLGALSIVSGVATALSSLTTVLAFALVIFGASALVLAYASWRGSRIGWAFAVTLDGVLAVCTLFGATKISEVARVPIALALAPCVLSAASCVLMASFYADYDNT